RLAIVAVAAAELKVELVREVDRRVREARKFFVGRVKLEVAQCRAEEGRQGDGCQRAGLEGDEVLLDQPVFMRVEATDEPVGEVRLAGQPQFLREFLEVGELRLDELVGPDQRRKRGAERNGQ